MAYKNMHLRFNALTILVLLLIYLPGHAVPIPGFSYQLSCDVILDHKIKILETVSKVLEGDQWPNQAKENFSVMEFNVLNMVDNHGAKHLREGAQLISEGYKFFAKPLEQLEGVARVINKNRPALAVLVEVSSLKILKNFDEEFLDDQYEEFLIPGNGGVNINIGLLLRKDLPFEVEVRSHKNLVETSTGDLVFTRDLPAFIIREKGNPEPLLIVFGTHFKSQKSIKGDSFSNKKRTQQALAASLIVKAYEEQFPGTPILLTGDFNNDIVKAREFEPLKKMGMLDAFDAVQKPISRSQRSTHLYFARNGDMQPHQLDSIMLNKIALEMGLLKSIEVLDHLDPNGNPYEPIESAEERKVRPSDHLPLLAVFDLRKKRKSN